MSNINLTEQVKKATLCMTRQCWEQGILAQALLETQDYERLFAVVNDMVLRQSEDGRLCNIENTPAVIDSSFCIGATYHAGKMRDDGVFLRAAEKNVSYLLHDAPRSPDGILYHMTGTQEIWADSAAFLPGVLALAGHPREGVRQMRGIMSKLYDSRTGLYFHMWDDGAKAYKKELLWGVGNGWILTGLLRLYTQLPPEFAEERAETAERFRRLTDAMLQHETEGHLFHDIMDDLQSFLETECAEMAAYAIYAGVRENLLDREYLKRADAIRAAVREKVDENGLVLDCASSPDFIRPGTSVEGQAHFLMMEHAAESVRP